MRAATGVAGRLLVMFLVIVPVLAAVVTITVWWLPSLVLAASGVAFLGLGAAAARRDARDPVWQARRCADCSTAVPDGAAICPRCRSIDIIDQWWHLRRDRPAEQRRRAREEEERDVEHDRRYQDFPLLGNVAGLMRLVQWYLRFWTHGTSMDPDEPADMRWWSACMFLLAGLFGLLGYASGFGSWAMGLAFLFAMLATSAAAAVMGPRSMAEEQAFRRTGR